jgi:hypothetical protein
MTDTTLLDGRGTTIGGMVLFETMIHEDVDDADDGDAIVKDMCLFFQAALAE